MNQGVFTTMTYNDGFPLQPGGSFSNSQFGAQATPMPLDIALLQQKYGADPNTNSGNNTYTLVDANAVGTRYVGIWDTGGVDEIVYSGSRNTVIDLRPATLLNAQGGGGYVSYATGIWGGYVIAAGVTIENATGGLGSDTLTGNDAANVLTGNFGDDVLRGGAGADTLIGGDGNDTLDDTVGLNTYNGGSGTDFASVSLASRTGALSYTVGDAAITENGSALITFSDIEHVSIVGGSGNDVFVGGSFNDTLIGGAGIDTLTGGFGNDVYGVDSLQDIVNEAPGADIDTVETTLTNVGLSSFTNIEVLTYVGTAAFIGQGTSGANTINGGSGNDYIYAYGGDDLARGNAGIDVFILGDGSDTAFGGDGQDYLFGDLGNDFLHGEGGVDVLLAGDGDDTMFGGDSGDYFYGEDGNDTAFGDAGNDIFVLTAGNDEATGGDGQDYFYMGDGNDTLNGEGGVDVMLGEAGNDTFNPGLGVDYVFMGTGSDRLNVHFFNSGVTVLNDFTPGDGSADVIGLVGPFVTFADVQASISDFTTSGGFCILTLDADTSIWFIGVSPSQLTAGDFILGGG
jgi:Ca2+-binding RTX toxin-like protein